MGFRFRRSIRLLPGMRINLSKSGPSLSVGRRGATMNFGSKGTKMTVGLPGSGMSYSKKLSAPEPSNRPSAGRIIAVIVIIGAIVAGLAAIAGY
jgi:hypothetical protein